MTPTPQPPNAAPSHAGLEVENLTVAYETESGPLRTVRDFTLNITPGEIYGLVGESGSGKTTLARALVRYLPETDVLTAAPCVWMGWI